MVITFTQIVLVLFLIFALSRVMLRFRSGEVNIMGFIFWSIIFGSAIVVVLFPELSGFLARLIGIGRGADAIVYSSIVILFYLVFRIYVYIEDLRHEITDLVRKIALENEKKPKSGKSS